MSSTRTRPIEKFARAVAQCPKQVRSMRALLCCRLTDMQSAEYGRCIAADFNNVQKDKCIKEFLALKECYMVLLNAISDMYVGR